MNVIRSRCSVAETTTETFVEYVPVGGQRQRLEFTRAVTWLRESESRLLFVHGGKVLQEGSTFGDYYGYLTSFDIKEPSPQDIASDFGVSSDSSLEVEVRTTVFLQPVMQTDETCAYNKGKAATCMAQYVEIPFDWRQEITVDGETRWRRVERKVLGEAVTWSSKNSPGANSAIALSFRDKWHIAADESDGKVAATA
ncbi:MAG: hypothetical protein ACREPQ_14345 [Rhodanobacter sp.]